MSQWVCTESSVSSTHGSGICSVGQIYTSIRLMWNKKVSVSMYKKVQILMLFGQEYVQIGKICNTLWLILSLEGVNEFV